MTDEAKEYNETTEESTAAGDLGQELRRLGEQLGQTATAAWGSETSRTIRSQIGDALNEMVQHLDAAAKKIAAHEETQRLRQQAERVVDSVRESEIREEIQEGLLTGLKELNTQLEKVAKKLDQQESEEEPPAE